MRINFSNLAALVMLLMAGNAVAADYYVIVPVKGKTENVSAIQVALNSYTLPAGRVNEAYSGFDFKTLLQVTGDSNLNLNYATFTLASGSLPAGLSLSADGKLSGTPLAAGTHTFSVRVAYKTKTGEQAYQIVSMDIDVALASATLPAAYVGLAYTGFDFKPLLTVSGDSSYSSAQVTWSIAYGSLPQGLTLNSDGTISGTPTTEGTSNFSVQATYRNKNGQTSYQVVTTNITVSLATASLSNAKVGTAYSYDFKPLLTVSGDANYTPSQVSWSLVSGSLPAGVTLNSSTGVISGTPTSSASSSFTLKAAYKTKTGQQAYTLVASSATQSDGNSYGMVNETATLSLTAPAGTTFRQVLFASYGTPSGTGPNYVQGGCHAATSSTKVSEAFLNKTSGSIPATNEVFGDPCVNTQKRLAVVLYAY